jgi:hypothetical protein
MDTVDYAKGLAFKRTRVGPLLPSQRLSQALCQLPPACLDSTRDVYALRYTSASQETL